MTDLIWHEVLSLRKTIVFYVLFLSVYLGLALLGIFSISVATAMAELVLLMLPVSALFHDEQAGWVCFAKTTPIHRKQMVSARYLFTLLLLLFAAAIGLLVCVLLSITTTLQAMQAHLSLVLLCLDAGLVIVSILLPLCYQQGPKRTRPHLYALLLLPAAALFLAHQWNLLNLPPHFGSGYVMTFSLALVVCLSGLFLSYLMSCRIVTHKSF